MEKYRKIESLQLCVNSLVHNLSGIAVDKEEWRINSDIRQTVERLIMYLNENVTAAENPEGLKFVLDLRKNP